MIEIPSNKGRVEYCEVCKTLYCYGFGISAPKKEIKGTDYCIYLKN